jgi:hypothetical protein
MNKAGIENYNLGAYYCRQLYEEGGVAIFVHNSPYFSHIDIGKHCEEQDIEICTIKLSFSILNMCINTLYSPSGNFSCFLLKLDTTLQLLYALTLQIIICEDIYINYPMESEKINQMDNLLLSYNLTNTINFPVRMQNMYATAIDNIFIDISQFESYTTTPTLNSLSHHGNHLLIISTDYSHKPI